MRLIDADLALEKIRVLEKEPDYQHEDEDWRVGLCMAEQAIDDVPTSGIVEQIFADLFDKVGFDGHNISIFKNELIEVARKYGVTKYD